MSFNPNDHERFVDAKNKERKLNMEPNTSWKVTLIAGLIVVFVFFILIYFSH